ncbi:MAG TPA: ribokinase [Candidatus Methylacidiphilales bacterium]|jgi:ribokinase|nr:ribokinase [Candidatus Methylacidiphilales bacterium]
MAAPVRIVVVGSSNTDLVITTPRLPAPGETVAGGPLLRYGGGKGANQAVAAARAGARVTFIGARGDDDFGAAAASALKREGIDITHFAVRRGAGSGVALIIVGGAARENLITIARSANDLLRPADVARASSAITKAGAVVAQLEIPLTAVAKAATLAHKHRVPFILNPAPVRNLPASLLRHVSVLVPNEHEAALLTGERDPKCAAKMLLAAGCGAVVITLGAKGALIAERGELRMIPAPRVKPVDTVGAGDCFTGWLAAGIAEGLPLAAAAARAAVAASISVTRPGAQASMPKRKEVIGHL